MARYVVATHRAIVPRDWVCKACEAYGLVAVNAVGRGRKRVWLWFRDAAADRAHDVAATDLQDDADRICELVRCPKCGKRAPNAAIATLFHGFRDVALGVLVGLVLFVLAWDKLGSPLAFLAFVAGVAGMVWIGDERRRYKAAAVAVFDLGARSPRPTTKPPVSSAPKGSPAPVVAGDPFRELPAPPPIAVVRPEVQTAAPVVAGGSDDDKPKFLS